MTAGELAKSLVAGYPCKRNYLDILKAEAFRLIHIQIECGLSLPPSSEDLDERTAAILARILSVKGDLDANESRIARMISERIAEEGPTEDILEESYRLVVLVCISPDPEVEREESLDFAVWIARFLRTAYKNKTGREYILN